MTNHSDHMDQTQSGREDQTDAKRRQLLLGSASTIVAASLAHASPALAQTKSATDAAPSVDRPPLPVSGNTVLITGGATGLGLALAQWFHQHGNTVIIASRRTALLETVASGFPNMHAMTVDIRDADSVERLSARILDAHPNLNILVNNAGIMRREDMFNSTSFLADSRDQVETNLNGTIRVTTALLSHLRARPRARIVNISSGLGFVPRAAFATYSSTKFATHAYTLSLRHQLRNSAVDVVEFAPPALRTEIVPGQSKIAALMTVEDYIREGMAIYQRVPTPLEVIVPRAAIPRYAEAEGRFWTTFDTINRLDS